VLEEVDEVGRSSRNRTRKEKVPLHASSAHAAGADENVIWLPAIVYAPVGTPSMSRR
jgi:hypothetical protein